jgi:hypothetical protein
MIDWLSGGRFGLPKLGRHKPTFGQREPALLLIVALGVFSSLLAFRGAGLVHVERVHSDILPPTS